MSNNPKYYARLPSKLPKERRDDKRKESGQYTKGDECGKNGCNSNKNNNKPVQSVLSNGNAKFEEPPPPLIDISVGAIRCSPPALSHCSSSPPPLKFLSNLTWEQELGKIHNVPAVEVIVANLPPGMYQRELYVMCEKFSPRIEPLHIEMNVTPYPYQIHYAIVYVKTLKHGQMLVSSLDGQIVENNYLVVALADKILEQLKIG